MYVTEQVGVLVFYVLFVFGDKHLQLFMYIYYVCLLSVCFVICLSSVYIMHYK